MDMTSLCTSGRKLSRKTVENAASDGFGSNYVPNFESIKTYKFSHHLVLACLHRAAFPHQWPSTVEQLLFSGEPLWYFDDGGTSVVVLQSRSEPTWSGSARLCSVTVRRLHSLAPLSLANSRNHPCHEPGNLLYRADTSCQRPVVRLVWRQKPGQCVRRTLALVGIWTWRQQPVRKTKFKDQVGPNFSSFPIHSGWEKTSKYCLSYLLQ